MDKIEGMSCGAGFPRSERLTDAERTDLMGSDIGGRALAESPTPPIFIVGAARSGTTLTAKILGKHSRIFMPGETHFFDDIYSRREELGDPDDVAVRLTLIDRLSTIYQRYNEIPDQGRIDKLFSDPCVLMSMETVAGNYRDVFSAFMNLQMTCIGKARWGNNVPRDIFNIEDIVGFYPDAKFLICVRDARDFALSYRYQWRKEPAGEQADRLKQLYHPIIAALLWKACVKQISKAKCLIPADNLMVLKYEELVNNPRAVVQEVCQFIGEEFEEAMLEVGGHNSSFPTEDKNIFATGVGRWRTQLSREEVYLIQKIAHKELADLGYVSEDIQPNPLMLSYYTMVVPFAFIRLLRVNRALFGPVVPYLFRRLRLLVS